MAGKPGRSGGARPGAGRKKQEPTILQLAATYDDPAKFLAAVMNDSTTDVKVRTDAAKALMPYKHPKLGEGGKKGEAADKAKKAGAGKFGSSAPPRLAAAGGKRV
jgi:phage terminase small subunit